MTSAKVRQRPGLSVSSEHYLRTILELREERGYARVVDIAARMGLTKGSVSVALAHLAERGLVRFDAAHFPLLTTAGRRVALDVRGRFQIVLTFLTEVLGLPVPLATAEACRWEHVVSHDVADRILDFIRFTAFPRFDIQPKLGISLSQIKPALLMNRRQYCWSCLGRRSGRRRP